MGLLGEILPHPENHVTIAEETDRFGLPVAKVTFGLPDNDKKLIAFGKNVVMDVMHAAGARDVVQGARYAYLVGVARMGSDAVTSVVDGFSRTHDIANPFICEGRTLPTQRSVNPGLTIMALAACIGDYLIMQGDAIFSPGNRPMGTSPIRRELAPPDPWGRGVPVMR